MPVVYDIDTKTEAVSLYMELQSVTEVAKRMGIPRITVQNWKTTDWWDQITDELSRERAFKTSNKMKSIAAKALEVTTDRLENGDFFYDQKTGELVRRPVPMREAVKAATSLSQEARAIEKPVAREQKDATATLADIAKTFKDFAKQLGQKPTIEVTDVILGKEL